jgi:hypothetical protein
LSVKLWPAPPMLTCKDEPEFVPFIRVQVVSFAAGSGVQLTVAAPVKPPLGVTVKVEDPPAPGFAMTKPVAALILTGPRTMRDCATGVVEGE